ncbi:cytochrome P450 9c1 [Drosophila guanche]|uniref:Blast:Cytochrome P450 9c1 n=2 Tax=Drosophila guanche TaxID=7266 RepID=A0A3B0J5P4_DROGU|nr:cytochrome P450 9c1 [Drosophila guanche]SPP75002.1 blast:Cytochrome P450 9c1 [Drosophila guanche]
MAFEVLLALTALIGYLLYKWAQPPVGYFLKRGVVHEAPVPLLGNIPLPMLFGKGSYPKQSIAVHMRLKEHKVYGVFSMRDPLLYIADPELIRQVGIKSFENFTNHRKGISDGGTDSSSLLSKSLLSLRDRRWKQMRNTLTPSFSSLKIRLMFELIQACNVEAVAYLERKLTEDGATELELKEFFTRYTNDVIATAAFGIQVNSFKDPNNEFFTIGQRVSQFSIWVILKVMLFILLPKLMNFLRVPVMDMNNIDYFKKLVFGAIEHRKEHNIVRPDMIQQLMEAQRKFREEQEASQETTTPEDRAEFNDEDLLAQCLLFFSAGFETVATCLCFTSHELLMNPEVQDKLYEEIMATEEQLGGKPLDFDTLMGLKYLDCVVSESLRMWPPAIVLDRMCGSDVQLRDEEGNLVVELKQDDLINIPVIALHHDPDNFPQPEQFRPERFDDDHKHEIKPFTYLPFGIGQRSCIGNRMALMEVKALLYRLVLRFRLEPAERTTTDMMGSIAGFHLMPRELFWCKLVARDGPDGEVNALGN